MFLLIHFAGESMPFILEDSEAGVLRAIDKAKEMGFSFDGSNYVVEEDCVVLHARSKRKPTKKRLYCLKDRVILQTDCRCSDEVEATRSLLAYEKNVPEEMISVVEI